MFAVILDTCVLWPSLQRDVLLSFAIEGLYRPLWSTAILDELEYHEAAKLQRRGISKGEASASAHALVTRMADAFEDACVNGWEPLNGTYRLPDPDDEHLVAAAVVGGAGAIVTENVKDLPRELVPDHIQVISAKIFAADTVSLAPAGARLALEKIATRYRHPPTSVETLLDVLDTRYGWSDAVEILRDVA